MPTQTEFEQRISRISELVEKLEHAADPASRSNAQELLQILMDMYGAGFTRVLELLEQRGEDGRTAIEQFGHDPLIRSLLLLHGLHPVDLKTRVLEGLEKARPYLKSHKGNVELVDVDDAGAVRLRLEGSCHGCPSSSMTLKMAIEDAIREAAPDVTTIEVVGQPAPVVPGGLPVLTVGSNGAAHEAAPAEEMGWEEIPELVDLKPGGMRLFPVGDRELLCSRLGDVFYAYGDRCPACGERLVEAVFRETAIHCAGCGQSYDVVHAGRGIARPELHLEPVPLLMDKGRARVALPLVRIESGSV